MKAAEIRSTFLHFFESKGHTIVFADNAIDAKLLGEAHFGKRNVLNYTEVPN